MEESRNQLKTMNRQFSFYTDQKTAMKNNLIDCPAALAAHRVKNAEGTAKPLVLDAVG